jgi:hypothetical protein
VWHPWPYWDGSHLEIDMEGRTFGSESWSRCWRHFENCFQASASCQTGVACRGIRRNCWPRASQDVVPLPSVEPGELLVRNLDTGTGYVSWLSLFFITKASSNKKKANLDLRRQDALQFYSLYPMQKRGVGSRG